MKHRSGDELLEILPQILFDEEHSQNVVGNQKRLGYTSRGRLCTADIVDGWPHPPSFSVSQRRSWRPRAVTSLPPPGPPQPTPMASQIDGCLGARPLAQPSVDDVTIQPSSSDCRCTRVHFGYEINRGLSTLFLHNALYLVAMDNFREGL